MNNSKNAKEAVDKSTTSKARTESKGHKLCLLILIDSAKNL